MVKKKILLLLLVCGMVLGGLSGAVLALDPQITVGQTVTVTADRSNDTVVELYRFTPGQSGTYVLYLASGDADLVHIGVLGSTGGYLSRGTRRCVLEAQAGQTYWFEIESIHTYASQETVRTFTLEQAVPVSSIALTVTEYAGYAGVELWTDVIYTPLNAVGQIAWSVEPAAAVRITESADSCLIHLEKEGTATVTAAADNGASAQCRVTVREMEALSAGQSTVLRIPGSENSVDAVQNYRFTADKTSTYVFSAHWDESDRDQHILLYVQGTNLYSEGTDRVSFEAQAGQEYLLSVNYWGEYTQTTACTLTLEEYPPLARIELESQSGSPRVGDTWYVEVLQQPQPCLSEAVTWMVSDPEVASLEYGCDEYAELKLLSAGTVTVIASTESGKTASLALAVQEAKAPVELLSGEELTVTLEAGEIADVVFTPEESGYYYIGSESRDAFIWMDAERGYDGTDDLLLLTGGETYHGRLYNLAKEERTFQLRAEKREILRPTALSVTKLPDNTTFLKGSMRYLRSYRILAGLELEVTWSDGSQTTWRYDTDPMYLGTCFIDHSVAENEDGTGTLTLECNGIVQTCPLTILDLDVEKVELVDESPILVVENSCGIAEADRWVYASNVYQNRQVELTFSDGSTVTVFPGEAVYGMEVETYDNQDEHAWIRGEVNTVEYCYAGQSAYADVQIVSGNVERIELVTLPKTEIALSDKNYFYDYGYGGYFSPVDLRDFLGELSLIIYYTDGTSKTVTAEQIQWVGEYPYVDGYPLGYFGEAVNGSASISEPCRVANCIEYMGASAEYTIRFVMEPTPGTGDADLLPLVLLALCMAAVLPVIRKKLI